MRIAVLTAAFALACAASMDAQREASRGAQAPADLTGQWTGTWSAFNPARASVPPKELCAKLTATIAKKGDVWNAVFEGDCGRPYKYSITMEGRPAGGAVMFKGSADLGPKDGGVYHWIGRADAKEFVGFFTSAAYTGVFTMTRQK